MNNGKGNLANVRLRNKITPEKKEAIQVIPWK